MSFRIWWILPVFILLAGGCKTISRQQRIPETSVDEVMELLEKRNIPFEWFNGKMSTTLESPDEQISGSMILRMKKDSAVWVAVRKFGIEAARVLVDKKSYTILYRLESSYESGSIARISDIFSVSADFKDIQSLMVGNSLLPRREDATLRYDSTYYVLEAPVNGLQMSYYVHAFSKSLDKISITDKMNRNAEVLLSDYRLLPGFGYVAHDRTYKFPYSDNLYATLQMKFTEIEINVPREIKFTIPENYEKIN
jgi:hypothetical protein